MALSKQNCAKVKHTKRCPRSLPKFHTNKLIKNVTKKIHLVHCDLSKSNLEDI